MTKLLQWLCFLGLIFGIWISLLTDILPINISKSVKDVVLPVCIRIERNTTLICTFEIFPGHAINLKIISNVAMYEQFGLIIV